VTRSRAASVVAALIALVGCDPIDPHIVPRPDNLKEDRSFLSPPTLQYPIYACGQSVVVESFVPGARIDVFVSGTPAPVGSMTSWLSGGQNIVVGAPFAAGQQITATQTFDGATSGPSNSVTVVSHTIDYASGLPQPRLNGVPCFECGKAVGLADYVPSALVRVLSENRRADGTFDPPVEIGQARDWSYAIVNPALSRDAHVWATQELCTDVSPRSFVETVQPGPATLPVPILDPWHEGVNIVTAWGPGRAALVHGAQVDIFTNTQPPPGRVGGQPTPGGGGQQVFISPVAALGEYWPSQGLCANVSTGTPTRTRPCAEQPPATIRPPIPGDTQIELLSFIPGARILVFGNGGEIGDGGGPRVNLKRAVNQGETLVVLQLIGSCRSTQVYQIQVDCSLGGDARACSNEWPMFRHNALRNASQPNDSPLARPDQVKRLREIWRFNAPPATERDQQNFFRASAVVHEGRVYVGNANGHLYALDAGSGTLLWQFPASGPPLTSLYLSNPSSFGLAASAAMARFENRDLVIFGAPDRSIAANLGSGRLFALDAVTGALVWASPELARLTGLDRGRDDQLHEQLGYSAPVVLGNAVYAGIADHGDNPIQNGRVVAVRLSDGQPLPGFSFSATGTRGGGVWSPVAGGLDGGALYVTTGNSNRHDGSPEPSPNHGLSLLRLDPASGAVVWKLQPVPFAMDMDPDWAAGASLVASDCGQMAVSTMKDGWTWAAVANAGGAPAAGVRWRFPAIGPFTPGDGTRHGDSRYLVPGAAWKDVFITMAGGEGLTQEYTFTDSNPWALPPQIWPGFGKLHALNLCASGAGRVRWIADVPSVAQNQPYQLGPPTVTRGIVYVGTASGHLVAIADPTVYPGVGSRCVRTDVSNADCLPNGFPLVPIPRVLLDLSLDAGEIRTEPVLARGRVFVATVNGTLIALQPR
jgi:outer membrane protein assembly factor BamB